MLFYNFDIFVLCFESEVVVYDGNFIDLDVIVWFCYIKLSVVVYMWGNYMVIDMVFFKNGFFDFIVKYEFLGYDEGKVFRFFFFYIGLVLFICFLM